MGDWKQINKNLVLMQEYTEIYGGTKFGVFIDDKIVTSGEGKGVMPNSIESLSEMDKLWKEAVAENDDFDEWTDDLLKKASKFWIEEGVSIIGCNWGNGIKVLKENADAWNM